MDQILASKLKRLISKAVHGCTVQDLAVWTHLPLDEVRELKKLIVETPDWAVVLKGGR